MYAEGPSGNIVAEMFNFLTGTGLWIAFIVCVGGLMARFLFLLVVSRRRDRILYNHVDFVWGVKSIVHWMIPGASVSMRLQPFFTFVGFGFHITLLAVPLFLQAHNVLFQHAFGISLPSISNDLADVFIVVFFLCWLVLLFRRIWRPEVRILTGPWEYALLLFTLLPFVTGFLAFHQIGSYQAMMFMHVLSAELLLILIPATRLSHCVLFFITRAFIGFELGARRGARSW